MAFLYRSARGPTSAVTRLTTASRPAVAGASTKSRSVKTVAPRKVFTKATINPKALAAQYAVRGELVIKAMAYEAELAAAAAAGKPSPLPFEKLVYCNIGNPQSLEQKPITFFRQVLTLCDYPELMEHPDTSKAFPEDAKDRARKILTGTKGGTGAYSESQGIATVRRDVADFITQRDGHPAVPENIFLTEGASQGISVMLHMLTTTEQDGVMIPIPQYPLYTASLSLHGATPVGYNLNEAKGWSMDTEELFSCFKRASEQGVDPRALVVINPGNPSGAVLDEANMRDVVSFCSEKGLALLADEVYQTNIYNPSRPFSSFKKIVCDMNADVELLSFHSVSKGFVGECGRRGGYMEITNILPEIISEIYKVFSIGLCSNIPGQIAVGLMVNPPKQGDASFPLYKEETDAIFSSLQRRAKALCKTLNEMDGVSCQEIQGAMYAFPSIEIPAKAVAAAEAAGKAPDAFYALELLAKTGVCVVPGSGFGQVAGTYHVRTTFLPPENDMDRVMASFTKFNNDFMAKYK